MVIFHSYASLPEGTKQNIIGISWKYGGMICLTNNIQLAWLARPSYVCWFITAVRISSWIYRTITQSLSYLSWSWYVQLCDFSRNLDFWMIFACVSYWLLFKRWNSIHVLVWSLFDNVGFFKGFSEAPPVWSHFSIRVTWHPRPTIMVLDWLCS